MLLKKPPEFWTNKPLGNPGRFKRLKLAGTYEIERARLAAYLEPPNPAHERLAQRIENGEFEPVGNFLDGVRSPDLGQRERFERLYEEAELADKTPREFWHILLPDYA